MKNETQTSNRRGRLILTAGLLVATITIGLIMKLQAADGTPVTGWSHARSGPVTLKARADRTAVLQGDDGNVRLELILEAAEVEGRRVSVPTDLLVVLDCSGSMQGEKLEQGRAAIRELIRQLGAKDRFALVTYSYEAELTIALERASEVAKANWESRLYDIYADGGTNMSHGLDVAYETLSSSRDELRAAKIILISDGLANHGDASEQGLIQRAARFTQQEQVLSAVGVGLDFNEFLMSKLADAGTGNYYYVEQTTGLAKVFANEFTASRNTVASALSVTLAPGPGVQVVDVAGYPLERKDGQVTFRPGTLFSGQERRVWVTYQVPTSGIAEFELGAITADYRSGGFLYVKEKLQDEVLRPMQFGDRQYDAIQYHNFPGSPAGPADVTWEPRPGAAQYEIGVLPNVVIASQLQSLQYILDIGVDRIQAHATPMVERLLREMPALGYPTITPPGMGTPLAAFQAPKGDELLAKLRRANVDVKVKWNQTRVSPSVYNNDDDIDTLLNALS